MEMVNVQMDIPKALAPFAVPANEGARIVRNAMMLYPFIQRGEISHGYAAEILGIHKIELIELYGKLELPYFTQSESEMQKDLDTLKSFRERADKC